MTNLNSKRVLVATSAVALALGAGGAIAASKSSTPRSNSFLARVAGHLGISTQKLQDATKAAAIDQVDADLEGGRITKAQADALKARIAQGDVPLFFSGPHRFGDFGHHGIPFGPHGHLSAAADYLGLAVPQLLQKLGSGQSLASVAKAQHKSVAGLKNAILDGAKKDFDQAIEDGYMTDAQANEELNELQSRLDDIVNGSFPGRPLERRGFHWRQGPSDQGGWRMPPAA